MSDEPNDSAAAIDDLIGTGLDSLLDQLDVLAVAALVARVKDGTATAADLAQANAFLKRHGKSVVSGKGEAAKELAARVAERAKNRRARRSGMTDNVIPMHDELDAFAERHGT